MPRNATLEGFDLGDQVGDAGTELAEDRAELFLPPAAQSLDGKPPADGQLVFVKGDALFPRLEDPDAQG